MAVEYFASTYKTEHTFEDDSKLKPQARQTEDNVVTKRRGIPRNTEVQSVG